MSDSPQPPQADLSPAVRAVLIAAAFLVLGAGVPLFFAPDHTRRLFVFPVEPPLTAAFIGANFLAAAVIEVLSATRRRWVDVRAALPGVFVYAVLTLVVTLPFRGRFNSAPGEWVWLGVYSLYPVASAAAWLVQRRRRAPDPARAAPLPRALRVLLIVLSAALLVVGAVLLVAPRTGAGLWAWEVTPPWATYRTSGGTSLEPYLGCWLVGLAAVAAGTVIEGDARRAMPVFAGAAALGLLQGAVMVRFAGEIVWWFPESWALAGAVVACGAAGAWGLAAARTSRPEGR